MPPVIDHEGRLVLDPGWVRGTYFPLLVTPPQGVPDGIGGVIQHFPFVPPLGTYVATDGVGRGLVHFLRGRISNLIDVADKGDAALLAFSKTRETVPTDVLLDTFVFRTPQASMLSVLDKVLMMEGYFITMALALAVQEAQSASNPMDWVVPDVFSGPW